MFNDLIPTFEVGQKVIIHERIQEDVCPCCGTVTGSGSPFLGKDVEAFVSRKTSPLEMWECGKCGFEDFIPGGYYLLEIKGHPDHVYPYTLLELIEEE